MLATGTILQNRYRVISLLAQGGMGAVYHAHDTRLNIPIALKEMMPQPGLDTARLAQLRQQFQQEANVLAGLDHPNLVEVIDVFEEGNNAYLVMRLVEGESLADRIQQQGALPESDVLALADQLLDALAYCHGRGIIHRDVKPQNVIIRPDGQVVLVDFGLVKLWDPNDPHTKTVIHGLGTPAYAPPEQYDVLPGHTDPRSDLYALGATLYHALTGQAPPTANQRMAFPDRFPSLRAMNPRISRDTESAVRRAMELAVNRRFPTARVMQVALQAALRVAQYGPPPPSPTRGAAPKVPPSPPPPQSRSAITQLMKALNFRGFGAQAIAEAEGILRGKLSPWVWVPATILFLACVLTLMFNDPFSAWFREPPTLTPLPTPTPAPTPTAIPTPIAKRVTSAGTWRTFAPGRDVKSLALQDDLLWTVAANGVIAVWDVNNGLPLSLPAPLNGERANVVIMGPDEALWFGTLAKGVIRYDPGSQVKRALTSQDGLLATNAVIGIAAGDDGTLWLATRFRGVCHYNPADGSWQTFTTTDGLANDMVQSMTAGLDGTLWFGTKMGLSHYVPDTNVWETFTIIDGLADNSVLCIASAPDGTLWFGTENGANHYDPNSKIWQTLTTADGLASDHVYTVATAPDGSVWFGTDRGISHYDPETGAWQTLTAAGGLAGNTVSAIVVEASDSLWFATQNGVSHFAPAGP